MRLNIHYVAFSRCSKHKLTGHLFTFVSNYVIYWFTLLLGSCLKTLLMGSCSFVSVFIVWASIICYTVFPSSAQCKISLYILTVFWFVPLYKALHSVCLKCICVFFFVSLWPSHRHWKYRPFFENIKKFSFLFGFD